MPRAGNKRGSLDRDSESAPFQDNEGDEGDFDDQRPFKRIDYASSSDDEDEDEDGAPRSLLSSARHAAVRAPVAADDDGSDDTFLNLLTHFAALHVPSSSTKPEACPVCSLSFPLSEFADHVYSCIHSLDDVEKKEQERLDEQMARRLMAREVRLLDESERHSVYARDRLQRGSDCPDGAECQRTDHQHFALRNHPEVPCPVCSATFAPYEINAHINLCLNDTTAGARGAGRRPTGRGRAAAWRTKTRPPPRERPRPPSPTTRSWVVAPSARRRPPSSASAEAASGRRATTTTAAVCPSHATATTRTRTSASCCTARLRLLWRPAASSARRPLLLLPSSSSSAPSDLKLTVEQASAVASHIIQRKSRFDSGSGAGGGNGGNDPSLLSLLETFKQLGFTQENLSRLKEQQSSMDGAAAAGRHEGAPEHQQHQQREEEKKG